MINDLYQSNPEAAQRLLWDVLRQPSDRPADEAVSLLQLLRLLPRGTPLDRGDLAQLPTSRHLLVRAVRGLVRRRWFARIWQPRHRN